MRRLPGSHVGAIDGLAGLFWAVNRLVDHRIAHIPKGERPVGIEEFHTRRERLKLVAEFVALVPLTYLGQQCMSRIFW